MAGLLTTREKAELIIQDIVSEKGNNPVRIFKNIAKKEYISIHGPEHHIPDGASILVAFHNAGGNLDLNKSLEKLFEEGLRMPGAMCGLWGDHMSFTSCALGELGKTGGPRCCKRDAMIAFKNAVEYINTHYDVQLDHEKQACDFSGTNLQCIKERCTFYTGI